MAPNEGTRARRESGDNRHAIDATLKELDRMGRLEKVDAALIQMLRSMALALDANPFNSQMWREYRETILKLARSDADNGAVEDLLAELSAPVRDSKAR